MFYLDPQTLKRYTIGRPFEHNGIKYTKLGATHSTFISLGFTQVTVGPRPDGTYYSSIGPDNSGSYTSTPRDLNELKLQFKIEQKKTAHQRLRQTDWYVIRSTELGVVAAAVPTAVSTYRTSLRTVSDARCNQIEACATIGQLETLMKAPAQILSNPQDPNSPMITNPAALVQWPEELASTYNYL